MKKKRIVLIDSHALLHRSYHAMGGFSTRDGRPTGALFGFIKMILKIKDELKPDFVIATFDRKEATFRHHAYENYKQNRKAVDNDLIEQIKIAPTICKALDIEVYSLAGFEADDLLGTICEELKQKKFKIKDEDFEVFIASGDMDTMQLIDKENNIKVYTLKKGLGETIIYNYEDVIKKFNFTPEQIVDYKALRGDASDNIIGIKGIGEKTATTIINLFGNIEKMYDLIHKNKDEFIKICKSKKEYKLTDRIINLIIEGEDEAIFSKTLATIRRDAPIDFVLPEKEWLNNFNDTEFRKICDEYEFRSLKNSFSNSKNNIEDNKNNLNNSDTELNIGGFNLETEIDNLKDLKVMTNLLDSEITNPDLEIILEYTNTNDKNQAEKFLIEKIKEKGLYNLYINLEKPLEKILEQMKEYGIKVDKNILEKQKEELEKKILELEKEIYNLAKEEFNISSPKQLGIILYEKLKLGEKIKKTAGGKFSTNAEQLEKIKDKHDIVNYILEYRELSKLLNTYIISLSNFINEKDQKIHSDFIQTGTATGRFSSENPNLQNLPAKSEIGILIRKAFIASDNYKLVSFDYSQIDLRSAAILSQDNNLLEIFKNKIDIHTGVAAKVFKVDINDVNKEMRNKAKAINFGIIYGMGVIALKDAMKTDRKEAQEFFDEYKKTFSMLMNYLDKVKIDAEKNGFTETLLGRRRQIPLLKSRLPFLKAQGERIAINAGIQGTTADILKLAMIDIDEYIIKNNLQDKIKILLQIHDELVLEIKENILEKESENIKNIMENVLEKRIDKRNEKEYNIWKNIFIRSENEIKKVPLIVNMKIGDNLYDIK